MKVCDTSYKLNKKVIDKYFYKKKKKKNSSQIVERKIETFLI